MKKILVCNIAKFDSITYPIVTLQSHVREAGIFSGGRTSLRRLLNNMGFTYKTINNKRLVLLSEFLHDCRSHDRAYYEQPRIVHQRHTYLRRMRRNRIEGRPVVYLDETWANAHDGKKKAWVEKDTTTKGTIGGVEGYVVKHCIEFSLIFYSKSGKGERLIILHAGGKDGWISGKQITILP